MAVTIGRTAWTDDDGTGTTGTILNNAAKTSIYDQIDTALALLLPLAGGTLTGQLNLSYANPTYQGIGMTATTGTNGVGARFTNTGGPVYIGRDSSIGAVFGAGNYSAYVLEDSNNGLAIGSFGVGGNLRFWAAGAEQARVDLTGSLQIGGTAARAGTAGTKRIDIFNGTAPTSTLANGISLYSTAGELRVMDAGGTATLLSPHDHTDRWVFLSENRRTRKYVRIEVEQLLTHLNRRFGKPSWIRHTREKAA